MTVGASVQGKIEISWFAFCRGTIWTPTEGVRLMASRQSGGCAPALGSEPKVRTLGEPTGTALDRHEVKWQGRCCHKRRLKNRLMVRGCDPQGLRSAWLREFFLRSTFEVSVTIKINIAARLWASRQYQDSDLTGRRGSFTRSSLLCL
jgi:hypothetical protein